MIEFQIPEELRGRYAEFQIREHPSGNRPHEGASRDTHGNVQDIERLWELVFVTTTERVITLTHKLQDERGCRIGDKEELRVITTPVYVFGKLRDQVLEEAMTQQQIDHAESSDARRELRELHSELDKLREKHDQLTNDHTDLVEEIEVVRDARHVHAERCRKLEQGLGDERKKVAELKDALAEAHVKKR